MILLSGSILLPYYDYHYYDYHYYYYHYHHPLLMQGIYTYIPETNYVPREYSVAAILLLLFKLVSLYSTILMPFKTHKVRFLIRIKCLTPENASPLRSRQSRPSEFLFTNSSLLRHESK